MATCTDSINPSRRMMLRRVPAMMTAAAALPMAALVVDPIFAKIEAYHQADDAFGRACNLTDEIKAKEQGRIITEEDEHNVDTARALSDAAMDDIIRTAPTTVAGIHAMLRLLQDECLCYDQFDAGIETILSSPVFSGGANV